jgi:hypothetical protein
VLIKYNVLLGPVVLFLEGTLLDQAQALAVPAEGKLNAGQTFFIGPFGEKLAGYFHRAGKVVEAAGKVYSSAYDFTRPTARK